MAIRLSVSKLKEQGFSQDQIDEIVQGIEDGCNVGFYLEPYYSGLQMHQIRLGLMEDLDVGVYCKPEYDWFQMEELRKGLRDKVDIKIYADPKISYNKMREIRKALVIGHDITDYLNYPSGIVREYRKALEQNINLDSFIQAGYDADQLEQICKGLAAGLPIEKYLDISYPGAALQEIRRGLEDGLEVEHYAGKYNDWRKMREIRLGLKNQVDISLYDNAYYSWQQMKEIRLGLQQGLSVEKYTGFIYPATEMRRVRTRMLEEIERALQEKKAREAIHEEDYSITFSEKNLEAKFSYHKEKNYLTDTLLRELLEKNNVCFGILDGAVEEILSYPGKCVDIVVARGVEPQNGRDGWFEYFFRTKLEKKPKEMEDGSVDYLNLDWFEMVSAGQKLAYYHKAEPGVDGTDVFGESIKALNGLEKRTLIGNGFRMDEERVTYYSLVDGKIELIDNRLNVSNLLRVDDVSLTTGNIKFNGSVQVKGNVEPGMVIDVAGDLVIDGTVAGATIICGGSVILKKGMNANGEGCIKAKGNVESRYFEAAKVECEGNIRCNTSLNSELIAKGTITSTTALAGGMASAEEGFVLKDAGNKAWHRTDLKVARDEELFQKYWKKLQDKEDISKELETLAHHHEDLTRKIKEFESMNVTFPGMDLYVKLEDAIYTKELQRKTVMEELKTLQYLMKKYQDAKVVIRGNAYRGLVVAMGDKRYIADNDFNITINAFDGTVS